MMSASSLVVILTLGLLRGCSCSAVTSRSSPAPSGSGPATSGTGSPAPPLRPRGFLDSTEDYDNFSDEPLAGTTPTHRPVLTPDGGSARLCDYDVCRENQTPCAQLAAASGCFCPGVSSYNDPPEPPVLKSVSSEEGGGAEATVRWCAPYSSVNSYVVTVGGKDRAGFGKERRSGTVGDMDQVTRVCVVALNDKGRSSEGEESCTMYRPDGGSSGASSWLRAGLIGGALGLLVLLSLALLLWRHRTRRRKAQASISS